MEGSKHTFTHYRSSTSSRSSFLWCSFSTPVCCGDGSGAKQSARKTSSAPAVALARAHAFPPLSAPFQAPSNRKPVLALEFGAAHRYFGDEGNQRESSDADQHPGVVHGGWWVLARDE
ncbi:hypothetical protein B0H14DRAFT_2558801 [Mycena olivaceomarginata]|nr:hypothetical protein B0H14DRAFT_2558801 [Mycena olivaceomarginata]